MDPSEEIYRSLYSYYTFRIKQHTDDRVRFRPVKDTPHNPAKSVMADELRIHNK